eukprot:6464998-Amphidinium_carterae.1
MFDEEGLQRVSDLAWLNTIGGCLFVVLLVLEAGLIMYTLTSTIIHHDAVWDDSHLLLDHTLSRRSSTMGLEDDEEEKAEGKYSARNVLVAMGMPDIKQMRDMMRTYMQKE